MMKNTYHIARSVNGTSWYTFLWSDERGQGPVKEWNSKEEAEAHVRKMEALFTNIEKYLEANYVV